MPVGVLRAQLARISVGRRLCAAEKSTSRGRQWCPEGRKHRP